MKTIILAICAIFGGPPTSYRLDHGVTIKKTSTAIEFRSDQIPAEDAVKFMLARIPMDCRHYNIRIVNNGDTLYVKDTDYKGNITFYTKKRQIKRIQYLFATLE